MGRLVFLCLLFPLCGRLAWAADAKTDAAKGGPVSIADTVEFYPPEGWVAQKSKDEATTRGFWKGRETFMAVMLLPAGARLDATAGPILAKQMLEKIQQENSPIMM